jgi:hypothetical protein
MWANREVQRFGFVANAEHIDLCERSQPDRLARLIYFESHIAFYANVTEEFASGLTRQWLKFASLVGLGSRGRS